MADFPSFYTGPSNSPFEQARNFAGDPQGDSSKFKGKPPIAKPNEDFVSRVLDPWISDVSNYRISLAGYSVSPLAIAIIGYTGLLLSRQL